MEFIMGGHSKGGNIAVYSAMECDSSIQSRIIKIYSHDGPGFKEDILKGGKYELIKDKIYKILPQSSIVGMLLHHQEDYVVVETPIGFVPTYEQLNWTGLDFSKEQFETVTAQDKEQWIKELESHTELFNKLGERLPAALKARQAALLEAVKSA